MTPLKKTPPRLLLFIFITVATSSVSARAQDSVQRRDIVELEKLEVQARRYEWHYARIDDFEILSGLDNDKLAAEIIQNALQIIDVFRTKSPLFRLESELPTRIILLKDQGLEKFITAIDERLGSEIERISRIKTQKLAHPELQGMERGSTYAPKQRITSLIKLNDEQAQIVMYIPEAYKARDNSYYAVSLLVDKYFKLCFAARNIKKSNLTYTYDGAKLLSLDSSERYKTQPLGDAGSGGEIRSFETVWYLLNRNDVLIRRYDLKRERLIFQNMSADYDKTRKMALLGFMAAPKLRLQDVLENHEVFRLEPDTRATMQLVENYITYKRQISDFSLYCVFSPDDNVSRGYIKLLNALKKKSLTESLFKECFGTGYSQFGDAMYAYYRGLGKDNYTGDENRWGAPQFKVAVPKQKETYRPVFRATQRSERARIFSDWFQSCKASHLAGEYLMRAEEQFPQALADSEFLAAYGLFEAQSGDKAKARDLLEKAVLSKTSRLEAYRTLAQLRAEEVKTKKSKGTRLSAADVSYVMEPIQAALNAPKHHVKTYRALYLAWRELGVKPTDKFLRILANGCLENPDNFALVTAVVPILRKAAKHELADKVLDAAAKCTLTEREEGIVEKLRQISSLDAAAKPDET